MNHLEQLLEDLKEHEGWSSKIYLDSKGYKTIGYGSLLEEGISRRMGEAMLRVGLEERAEELDDLVAARHHLPLSEHPPDVLRALLNMLYNLGTPRLMKFKRMWKALDARDYQDRRR